MTPRLVQPMEIEPIAFKNAKCADPMLKKLMALSMMEPRHRNFEIPL